MWEISNHNLHSVHRTVLTLYKYLYVLLLDWAFSMARWEPVVGHALEWYNWYCSIWTTLVIWMLLYFKVQFYNDYFKRITFNTYVFQIIWIITNNSNFVTYPTQHNINFEFKTRLIISFFILFSNFRWLIIYYCLVWWQRWRSHWLFHWPCLPMFFLRHTLYSFFYFFFNWWNIFTTFSTRYLQLILI